MQGKHCNTRNLWLLRIFVALLLVLGVSAPRASAQVTVNLAPVAHQQFLDSSGKPLAGGCVFSYAAGTTNLLATYVDSTGITQNPDPIILDAGGYANIWLAGLPYKFVVFSAGGTNCATGTLQWTVDNITVASGGSGGSGGGTPASPDASIQINKVGLFGSATGFGLDSSSSPTKLTVPFSISVSGTSPYLDILEMSAPFNPIAGTNRLYMDSSTGKLACLNSAGSSCLASGGGSATPGGTVSQFQYNSAGAFGGVPDFTFDSTHTITLGASGIFNIVAGATVNGITAAMIPTLNQNTTGSAAKWTTTRLLAGNSVDGSASVPFANQFIVKGTSDSGLTGAQFLGSLGTGLLKNTTSTGVLSIAASSDVYGLWTGTCNSTTFLRGDGQCQPASGGGATFQTNGVNNGSQSILNFVSSSTDSVGLHATPVNSTSTEAFEITGTAFTGSAAKWTTPRQIAGNSVDGSANVPFANAFIVNGTSDSGLSGAQFLGSLGTGIVKNTTTTGVLSIAGSADVDSLYTGTGKCYLFKGTSPGTNDGCDSPAGSGSGTVNSGTQFAFAEYATAGTAVSTGPTPPATNGQYLCGYTVTSSAAVAPTCPQTGISNRSITGAATTDTVTYADVEGAIITHDQAASGTVNETLPTATTLGNANAVYVYANHSAQTDTITPTTWTIQKGTSAAGASITVASGVTCRIHVDSVSATNWLADCGGTGTGTTITVASGTATLGTGAISSATCATAVTVGATGVATTDVITVGFNGDPTAVTGYVPATAGMLTIIPYPTANNINIKVCNNTTASITPGAITLNWRVVR